MNTTDRVLIIPRQLLLLVVFTVLLSPLHGHAVPAWPGVVEMQQPDGATFRMRLHGDEFFSWHETEDGYLIMRDPADETWKYAVAPDAKSAPEMLPDAAVGVVSPEALDLEPHTMRGSDFLRARVRDSHEKRATTQKGMDPSSQPPPVHIPVAGTTRVHNVVILAAFNDHWDTVNDTVMSSKGRVNVAEYDALFNEDNYTTGNAVGSVREYYREVSYGRLTVESLVTQWVRLPENEAYYGANDGPNNTDVRPREMTAHAVEAAYAAGFDFSWGDSDGDGWVDCLTIIHSGHGEEIPGNPSTSIWSHQWEMQDVVIKDGVRMKRYHTAPALRGSTSSTGIIRIGVICHEMGHFFGLPDLYDYSGKTLGVGNWCIMAYGTWNGGDGRRPAHFSAWSKYMLGLVQPEIMHSQQNIELPSATTLPPVVHMYRDGMGDREYYLVENRTKHGFDNSQEITSGILIYHIDDKSNNNDLNTWPHPVVKIEEADGNNSLGREPGTLLQPSVVWHSGNGLVGGFRDQTGNETTNAMRYQTDYYKRVDDPAYYSFITLDGFSATGDVMTYNATTLKTTVTTQSSSQPDYVVSWPASANAVRYELQEGAPTVETAFYDNAEDEDAMYANWFIGGGVQRSDAGSRSGNYSYVMQAFDGSRLFATVQSLTLRTPFRLQEDTELAFYYLSQLDSGAGYMRLQISNDGGETWNTVNEYSGQAEPWTQRVYDFTALQAAGMAADDECVIRFVTNFEDIFGFHFFPAYGYALDDIEITGVEIEGYGDWVTLASDIEDTHYAIHDKADGIYAYRVRAFANDTWQGFGGIGTTDVAVDERTVHFETDGTPGATLTGTLTQTVYAGADTTPVTANAPEAHRFVAWTWDGDVYATDNPVIVTDVRADITLVANFERISHTVTYEADGNGAIEGEATQTVFHGEDGTAVEAVPDDGYYFDEWSDGRTDNPRTDENVTDDLTVRASFGRVHHTLSLDKVGEGAIKLHGNVVTLPWEDDSLEAGKTIHLTAEAADGWRFTEWSGDVNSTLRVYEFEMDADYSIIANFTSEQDTTEEGEDSDDPAPQEGEALEGETDPDGEEGENGSADTGAGCCNSNGTVKSVQKMLGDWLLLGLGMAFLLVLAYKPW